MLDNDSGGGSDYSVFKNGNKRARVFKNPDINFNILENKQFAPESKRKMKWAVNLYSDWRRARLSRIGVSDEIIKANLDNLHSFSQSRFITEVRRLDGKDYPPNTLREIIICIQMFLHENCILWKLLDGQAFSKLRNVVDNTMKQRHSMGMGVRESSEVISLSHEDKLFGDAILGENTPEQLLNTVIYMIGMCSGSLL